MTWLSYVCWVLALPFAAAAVMEQVAGKNAVLVSRRRSSYGAAILLAGVAALLIVVGVDVR